MSKFDKVAMYYLIFSIPFILALAIWSTSSSPDFLSQTTGVSRLIWDSLGFIFMFWIITSLYILGKMLFSKNFREHIIKKTSRIQERDERESQLTGEAAKFSIMSTAAFLLLSLFLSLFTITIGRNTSVDLKQDKHGYISIGLNENIFKQKEPAIVREGHKIIFNYSGLPLSNSSLILISISWLFLSYKLRIRFMLTN